MRHRIVRIHQRILAGEPLGKDREVVLSYGLWKRRYGGDPSLVGRTIRMDGAEFTVIGVMPREFAWQFWSGPRQLWVPVGYTKTDFGRGDNSFIAIGRLRLGVNEAQARSEMEAVGSNVRRQYPAEDADMGATVSPLGEFDMQGLRATMLALLAATLPCFLVIVAFKTAPVLYAGSAVMGALLALMTPAVMMALSEGLPPSVRSGVIGFTYALAIAIFGGSAQFMVKWLIGVLHSPLAPGLYMSGALLIGITARLALPLRTDV